MRRSVAFGLALFAMLLTLLMYACVPASQRLTAPVLCPSGTTQSVVLAYSTSSGSGRSHFHSDLYCLDADGGGTTVSSVKKVAVQFGYASMVVFGLAFGLLTVRRIKRKKKEAAA